MKRADAREWLEVRLREAPARLSEAVRECLDRAAPDEEPESVGEWLASSAEQELDRITDEAAEEEAALRLLAADAVLTYAFEAAAEEGTDLKALAADLGPAGRLGGRLGERCGDGE